MGSSCMCDFPIYVHYMPWKIPCLNSKPKFEASSCVLHFPICLLVGLPALFARFSFHLSSVFFRTLHHIHCLHPHSYTNAPKKKFFRIHFTRFKAATLSKCTDKNKTPLNVCTRRSFRSTPNIVEHFSHFRH